MRYVTYYIHPNTFKDIWLYIIYTIYIHIYIYIRFGLWARKPGSISPLAASRDAPTLAGASHSICGRCWLAFWLAAALAHLRSVPLCRGHRLRSLTSPISLVLYQDIRAAGLCRCTLLLGLRALRLFLWGATSETGFLLHCHKQVILLDFFGISNHLAWLSVLPNFPCRSTG